MAKPKAPSPADTQAATPRLKVVDINSKRPPAESELQKMLASLDRLSAALNKGFAAYSGVLQATRLELSRLASAQVTAPGTASDREVHRG